MPETNTTKPVRPFKSAEKPVSLYPFSFKQAVIALLQVGPMGSDLRARAESTDGEVSEDRAGSRR